MYIYYILGDTQECKLVYSLERTYRELDDEKSPEGERGEVTHGHHSCSTKSVLTPPQYHSALYTLLLYALYTLYTPPQYHSALYTLLQYTL